MVAVVGVDAELVDDFEGIFTPVLDVDQSVVQRCSIVAGEAIALAEGAGGGEDVRMDDLFEEAREFAFGQGDAVQGFEFLAEVLFQSGAVTDVGAVLVFKGEELLDKLLLEILF